MKALRAFLHFLAKMGLTLRGDPPRKIDLTDRAWGLRVDGFVLSVREITSKDPDQLAAVSVVMKNDGTERVPFTIPGWMFFYPVTITAPLTAYGRSMLRPEHLRPAHSKQRIEIVLGPGDATETDIPVASIYELKRRAVYPLSVSCTLPGGAELRSNEIQLTA